MKCEYCGKVFTKDCKFCPECGAKVKTEEEKLEAELPKEETTAVSQPKHKGFAIAGFVLGLVGLVLNSLTCSILGVVFSGICTKKQVECNKRMYKAGLVLGIIGIVCACARIYMKILNIWL